MRAYNRVYIAGHQGMVGSALYRYFAKEGCSELIVASREELDLCNQNAVNSFVSNRRPEIVILAAAKVGGIYANNTYKAQFIYENLVIQQNVINAAYNNGVKRLIFLGSSCIYPRDATQPMTEEALLTSPLEPSNEPYAIAKICGLKLCQYYREQYGVLFHSVMPTNLYGPRDNYHPENSHVIPALIHKIHQAKVNHEPEVKLWGTGSSLREFLYVDDLAEAIYFVLSLDNPPHWINIGSGEEVQIKDLALLVKSVIGYEGEITFNHDTLDGVPRKLLNCTKIRNLGWNPKTFLENGLGKAYQCYLKEHHLELTS